MKRATQSESALIEQLTAVFAAKGAIGGVVRLGIGDDAAVLRRVHAPLVWTVDSSVEGVHFEHRWLTPSDIGARSFHAAVSDIAAMGARPLAALSSLVVPARFTPRQTLALVAGQAEASRALGCPLVGGNLSRGRELSVTTTVLGSAEHPLTRAAARAGDDVWLLGDVGLAGAGLLCLERSVARRRLPRGARGAVNVCIAAWRRPAALVREGRRLSGRARAVIDVSDGLGTDAGHIAERSRVRVVLEEIGLERVLRPELVTTCGLLRIAPLALALSGGEDYALVATGPAAMRPRSAKRIGRVERGSGVELEARDGTRRELGPSGFDHFERRK